MRKPLLGSSIEGPPFAFLMSIWLGISTRHHFPLELLVSFFFFFLLSIGYGLDDQKLSHDFMIGIEMKLVFGLARDMAWRMVIVK